MIVKTLFPKWQEFLITLFEFSSTHKFVTSKQIYMKHGSTYGFIYCMCYLLQKRGLIVLSWADGRTRKIELTPIGKKFAGELSLIRKYIFESKEVK